MISCRKLFELTKTNRNIFALLLFNLFICSSLVCQTSILSFQGQVADSITGSAIKNVNLIVAGQSTGGITDSTGSFKIKLDQIPALVYLSHLGYAIKTIHITKKSVKSLDIRLSPEPQQIDEILITGERIMDLIKEDTLNILDYEVLKDRIIFVASPYKRLKEKYLFITSKSDKPISHIGVVTSGKVIWNQESLLNERIYLFKDFTGKVRFLTKDKIWEITLTDYFINLKYPETYSDFLTFTLPMKCELFGNLYFQVCNHRENITYWIGNGFDQQEILKTVTFKRNIGYERTRPVIAPLFKWKQQIMIFDFFNNHIEFFDLNGHSQKTVPINFHTKKRTLFLGRDVVELNYRNFSEQILFDQTIGKAYAFFKNQKTGRQSLREINLGTGKIIRSIEIPDFTNIKKVRVDNNTVFFLYVTKTYPYYQTLYRLLI